MNKEVVFAVSQTIIALLVIVGGGVLIVFDKLNGSREAVLSLMGVVIGYYFTIAPAAGAAFRAQGRGAG